MMGVILLGIGLLVLSMTPVSLFWLGVATFSVIGLVIPLIDGSIMAIVQGTVAPEMQGRVLTTMMGLLSLTSPISLAVAGPVADWLGLKSWYFLAGALCIVAGIAGFLRAALLPLTSEIERAFLYGSVARGEERSDSDIDLMVIGDASFFAVVDAVSSLQESLGREINPTVFTATEVRERLNQGEGFLTRVMGDKKTNLIGGDDES